MITTAAELSQKTADCVEMLAGWASIGTCPCPVGCPEATSAMLLLG